MDTKSTLTSFWSAPDVRNQSQCFPPISIMLRLIAQLLRSSEIQLIEGEGRSTVQRGVSHPGLRPGRGRIRDTKNHEKVEKTKIVIEKSFFQKSISKR